MIECSWIEARNWCVALFESLHASIRWMNMALVSITTTKKHSICLFAQVNRAWWTIFIYLSFYFDSNASRLQTSYDLLLGTEHMVSGVCCSISFFCRENWTQVIYVRPLCIFVNKFINYKLRQFRCYKYECEALYTRLYVTLNKSNNVRTVNAGIDLSCCCCVSRY